MNNKTSGNVKVAVLLATYNGEKYAEELLESLKSQTYSNFICYIHDDGSTDSTPSICRKYAEADPNRFVILEYPSAGGPKENFFSMFRYVNEQYIMFCDQDDIWLNDKIEKSLDKIIETENGNQDIPAMVFTDLKIVDSELNVEAQSYLRYMNRKTNELNLKGGLIAGYAPGCAFILNRHLIEIAGKYQNDSVIFMHDWWCMLVAFACGGTVDYIDEPLILYRQHGNNCAGANKMTVMQHIISYIGLLFKGSLFNSKKEHINNLKRQAIELSKLPEINSESRRFLNQFIEIDKSCKLKRMIFYMKHYYNNKRLIIFTVFG